MFGVPPGSKRLGCEHAERAVGTVVVELVAPVGDEHSCFEERVELLDR